jgi:ATP-dependent helicase/nuclease subunit A
MNKPLKILQASAGSGKTFSLTTHYLTLLFSGENKYREILAVTFTNKATEEMKSRILEVLKGLAEGNNKYQIYQTLVLEAHPSLTAESLQLQADKIYRKILHDYSRFSVNTIDGFVQKVIRGFAFELGLDAGYSLEMNYDKVKQELTAKLEKLFDENDNLLQWVVELALDRISNNKSWNYNAELLKLVGEVFNDKFKGFETAIAQFGAENTDTVFKEYIKFSKELIKKFEDDLIALATNAQSIINESGLTPDDFKGKSRSPLLKFKGIINGVLTDVEKVAKLFDDEENWMAKGKQNILFANINPIINQLVQVYNAGYGDYILAKAFVKNGYFLRLMQEIAMLLGKYREESEALLISDAQKLLNGIAEDAGENPSFIWEKMGQRYRNFLFDEFQDTSANQWSSFKALVSNAVATHDGKLHDHLIVGDAKQSIYRWRDGDYKLLHQQAKVDLQAHNIIDAQLAENYRSTEEIISFNNQLYERLSQVLQDKINNEIPEDNDALNAFWNDISNNYGRIITDIYSGVAQKTHPNTKAGGVIKIKRIDFEKPKKEGEIATILTTDTEPENKKQAALLAMLAEVKVLLEEKGYQQRELGVLVRTNAEATEVVNALMEAGLDVISGEALKVANSTAIKLIVNALKLLLVTPENSALYKANCIALYAQIHQKAINGENYFGLKTTALAALGNVLPATFCTHHKVWAQLPIAELIEKIITAFGLDNYRKGDINPFLPYLLAFRDIISKATKQGEKGISNFLKWWDEEGLNKNLPSPETANAIQVMTIAKSKGLAFRAVFIPFCDWKLGGMPNGIFWVPMAGTPYQALQSIPLQYNGSLKTSSVAKYYLEELLFNHMDALNNLYVATTRAKDYIYMGVPSKKTKTLTNVGDAVLAVYEEEFGENSDELQTGTFSAIGDKLEKFNPLILADYPTTNRLSEVYVPKETRPQKYIDNITKSGRKGSALHAILANVNHVDEVDDEVEKLVLEGLLTSDEKADYVAQVLAVLSHAQLQILLGQNTSQLNERAIIGIDGKTYRPDKLIFNGKQVSIIDYKFTAEESDKHIEQIKNYQNLIEAMGYENVKPYLFYALSQKLKEV